MLYFHRTPKPLEWLYPGLRWHKDRKGNSVYLTFDDGPVPEITPEILDILAFKEAKATFFCVGDNARKYPHILRRVVDEGHTVGNHTFNHVNGWSVETSAYVNNVDKCDKELQSQGIYTNLFRPPYGRISRSQIKSLKKRWEIIMWDVLTGDFDHSLDSETCFQRTVKHVKPGSIIVMHDNPKASARTLDLLPRLIDYIRARELKCSLLPS
jgi:peptidoglycan/xylan/chitin deacetylase (PgdA/CDA1 family)